jgi:hypothetical protein
VTYALVPALNPETPRHSTIVTVSLVTLTPGHLTIKSRLPGFDRVPPYCKHSPIVIIYSRKYTGSCFISIFTKLGIFTKYYIHGNVQKGKHIRSEISHSKFQPVAPNSRPFFPRIFISIRPDSSLNYTNSYSNPNSNQQHTIIYKKYTFFGAEKPESNFGFQIPIANSNSYK